MIKRLKSKLIVLLACLAALFLFGGCTLGVTLDEILSTNHLVAQVTYYANKGKFDGGMDKKEMYYKDNSLIFNIGVMGTTNGSATVERSDYELEGWYFVETDESGNPKFADAEKKEPIITDQAVDFSTRIQKDEHWFIAAKWIAKVKLDVKLVIAEGAEIAVDGEAEPFKNGDILKTFSYDAGTDAVQAFSDVVDQNGEYVFVEYYEDADCTIPANFPVKKGETQTENGALYAKFIDDSWTVVKSAIQVKEMLENAQAGKKYWVARDIDATGTEIAPLESFACEVQGNGYAISNLTVSKADVKLGNTFSFLGEIKASAVLKNLTFKDLQAKYVYEKATVRNVKLYFICVGVENGATVENVAFTGENSKVTVDIKGGRNKPTTALFTASVDETLFDVTGLPEVADLFVV